MRTTVRSVDDAWDPRVPPAADLGPLTLGPGIWRIRVPFRSEVPYTSSYVVRDAAGGLLVVDPGHDTPENRQGFADSLRTVGAHVEEVAVIASTHLHRDHLGLAGWLSECSGAPVVLHAVELRDAESPALSTRYRDDVDRLAQTWGAPDPARLRLPAEDLTARTTAVPVPSRRRTVGDLEELPLQARRVVAFHTPGHTRGHLCFALPDDDLVLTGDHVLPHLHPGIGLGITDVDGDPVGDYLRSLERLSKFDGFRAGPGHGEPFAPLGERRRALSAHVLRRARQVSLAAARDPEASVWQIASTLSWSGGFDGLAGARLQSALSQTGRYLDFLRRGGFKEFPPP